MKKVLVAAILSLSVNAMAFTDCSNADGSLQVGIYATNPVKVLVMDKNVSSVAPLSYVCEMQTLTNKGQKLAAYGCVGGGMGEESQISIYVDESKGVAKYQDGSNESKDQSLKCEITK